MEKTQHIAWIDGLKGSCAIIVLVYHVALTLFGLDGFDKLYTSMWPGVRALLDGSLAVSVFIIMSAMLTAAGIERRRLRGGDVYRQILTKRYFRIMLPVAVVLVLMKSATALGLSYAGTYGLATGNEWLTDRSDEGWRYLPWAILLSPMGQCRGLLNVTWMLGYVFIGTFVTVCIDLMVRGRSRRGRVLVYAFTLTLIMALAHSTDPSYAYYSNAVVGYMLYHEKPITGLNSMGGGKKYTNFPVVICLLLFVAFDLKGGRGITNVIKAWTLVITVSQCISAQRLISCRLLCWLGKLSMNIYLLHLLVCYAVVCRIAPLHASYMDLLQMDALAILLTVALAWVFTRYVEPVTTWITNRIMVWLE